MKNNLRHVSINKLVGGKEAGIDEDGPVDGGPYSAEKVCDAALSPAGPCNVENANVQMGSLLHRLDDVHGHGEDQLAAPATPPARRGTLMALCASL